MRIVGFVMTIFASLFYSTACLTVMTGKNQKLPIDSNPQGAEVYLNNEFIGSTPLVAELNRNEVRYKIQISKMGYLTWDTNLKSKQSTVRFAICMAEMLSIFFLIPGIIDMSTGQWTTFPLKEIFIDLIEREGPINSMLNIINKNNIYFRIK